MIRRVLLTADTLGGVRDFALELARGLSGHGMEVTLATLGGALDDSHRRQARAVPGLRLHESDYRLEWMAGPWADVERAGAWLLHLAAETGPDVVHLNQYSFGALNWPVPTVVTAHSCVYSWTAAVHDTAPRPEWYAYWRAVRQGLAGADAVTAPTAVMLAAAESHYGVAVNGRVIANGRRSEAFAPGRKQPRILAVGRLWDRAKNLETLIRAAPRLAWPVRLIGPDRGPDGERLAPPNGVELLAPRNGADLAREYGAAAIYAAPARYEPFGLSILEAALAGCALVLGDIPSLREVWGDAARFVAPDDSDALTATLQRLIGDRRQREAYGRRAREQALHYGADRMTRRYLELYQSVTNDHGGR